MDTTEILRTVRKRTNLTRHQWKLLFALGTINFVGGLIDTIQAPTYNPTLKAHLNSSHSHTHDHSHNNQTESPSRSNNSESDLIIEVDYKNHVFPLILRSSSHENHHKAKRENASDTSFGLFVAGFDITQLIFSPIIGSSIHILGPKNAFMAGVLTDVSSTTVFGLVKKITNEKLQNVLLFITRIISGIGSSAMLVGIYSLLATEFPRRVALAFAIIQTLNGFGKAVGPTVGVVLIQILGMSTFLALAMVHYFLACFIYSILPKSDTPDPNSSHKHKNEHEHRSKLVENENVSTNLGPIGGLKTLTDSNGAHISKSDSPDLNFSQKHKDSHKSKLVEDISSNFGPISGIKTLIDCKGADVSKSGIRGYISLLRIPAVLMYSFGVVVGALISGFVTSVLQPHLMEFSLLSSSPIGKIFLLFGSATSLFSIFWGFIVGRVKRPEFVALFGTLFIFCSILPIGPISFILGTQPDSKWSTITLILIGLGMGAINIAAFVLSLDEAKHNGFPENGVTSGLISSIFVASTGLGGFAGPAIATFLYDHVGFRNSSLFVLVLSVVLVLVFSAFLCLKKPRILEGSGWAPPEQTSEETPLLTDKYYYHVVI